MYVVIVDFGVVVGASLLTRYRVENNVSFTDIHNPELVKRGEYLTRASDYVGCPHDYIQMKAIYLSYSVHLKVCYL